MTQTQYSYRGKTWRIGDEITCIAPDQTYDGHNFEPGDKAIIWDFPPKVRIVEGTGKDTCAVFAFCRLDNRDTISLNLSNLRKI